MRVVTWNVNGPKGIRADRRERLVDVLKGIEPDLVLLQEVCGGRGLPQFFLEALAEKLGLHHGHYEAPEAGARLGYANLIASRWPVSPHPQWLREAPYQESVLRCTVTQPEWMFDVVALHAPNGSRHGWRKVETLEALRAGLEHMDGPVIVGGDFNEPWHVLQDGRLISFGMREVGAGEWSTDGKWRSQGCRRAFPRSRWHAAVAGLLHPEGDFALRDARRVIGAEFTPTHIVRNQPRCFDHLLVSPHWQVHALTVEDGRKRGFSDHAPVTAEVEIAPGSRKAPEAPGLRWGAGKPSEGVPVLGAAPESGPGVGLAAGALFTLPL